MFETTANAQYWPIDDAPLDGRIPYKHNYDILSARRADSPLEPAISFQLKADANAPAQTLNYQELHDKIVQCANGLRKLGINEDDAVAYIMPNCLEAVIINQAGMIAGKVAPINPLISPEHIGGILAESGAKIVVTLGSMPKTNIAQIVAQSLDFAPDVHTVLTVDLARYVTGVTKFLVPFLRPKLSFPPHITVRDFNEFVNEQSTSLEFEISDENRVTALFHTGGTTGRPKLVQHDRLGFVYNAWLGEQIIYEKGDTALCPLPMFHVFAAYPILACVLAKGAHMVMIAPAGYRAEGIFENFWKLVERWQVNLMIMVPTAAARLLSEPVNADVSTLRYAICGSAPLPEGLFHRFEEAVGVRILEGYGMTEATCLVAVNPIDGKRKIGSVGYPLPYTEVKILDCDESGKILSEKAVNEIGEICVNNPGVRLGQTYKDSEKNAGLFASGDYLRTGDLGRFDEEGFLFITGRSKDLIIRGGHNIDPALIEEVLATHPAVAMAGAVGQPDHYAGELPCAYVELVAGAEVSIDELMALCENKVAEKMAIPKSIEILDELPKTAVGKIFKPDLRKRAIRRVLSHRFLENGLQASIIDIVDDSKRGFVVQIHALNPDESDNLSQIMSEYALAWDSVPSKNDG